MSCMQNCNMGEKEHMQDLLSYEKFLCGNYCAFLSEAATPEVLRCLQQILTETHNMQQQLFQEMNSRGFYPVTKAEDQKVAQAKQKFCAAAGKC